MKRNGYHNLTLRTLLLLAVCGLATGSVHAEEGEGDEGVDLDYIKRVDAKKSLATKITKDDYISVEGKWKGVPAKVPGYAVEEVIYADRDSYYIQGQTKEKEGKYKTAARYFQAAIGRMKEAKWAAEYCNYAIAENFYMAGVFEGYEDRGGHKYDPTWMYYDKVLKANPKSRFALDCVVKKAICLAELGQLAEAEAAFKTAEDFINKYRNEVLKIDTKYLTAADRARVLAVLGNARMSERKADKAEGENRDYSKAEGYYKNAQSAASGKTGLEDVYAEAVSGELQCLVKGGDYGAARDRAAAIIDKFNKNPEDGVLGILPGAYTTMGQANFAQALKYESRNQNIQAEKAYAEARWNFQHVIVQFFDNDEFVALAHFFAGLCYTKLQEKEPDAIKKALRHWGIVKNDFKSSVFAAKAEAEIQKYAPKPDAAPATEDATEGAKEGAAKEDEGAKAPAATAKAE